jgi:uncharacterized sulfatase
MGDMTRKEFLKRAGAGALGLAAAPGWARAARGAGGRPPNIVFILADDLGWADLGCYGNAYHETPRIDGLAAEGMRFTDAYAACPVCSPTRASFMAGQYPARIGMTDFIYGHWRPYEKLRVPINDPQYLRTELTTVAEALGDAGYACGCFGKWHLDLGTHGPGAHGFDDFVETTGWTHFGNTSKPDIGIPEDTYLTEALADLAGDFMASHRDEPFFLLLSHFAVHIPLEARAELIARYQDKAGPEGGVNHPVYAAMVEHLDRSVGTVLDRLDTLGLADDTLVVFYSDNGGLYQRYDGQGDIVTTNAPLRGEKGTLYEGGIREPLIVRWPGRVEAGAVCREPVTTPDFYPTFLEMAGAAPPDQPLDGASLLPLLNGAGGLDREAIYWHYPHYHHSTPAGAVRAGDWKCIEFFEDGRLELYNLALDPAERHNRASEHPDRATALQARLAAWRAGVEAAMPEPNPDFDPMRRYEWGRHPSAPPVTE